MIKVIDLINCVMADRFIIREVHCFAGYKPSEVIILADFDIKLDGCEDEAILNRYAQVCYPSPDDPNCFIINVVRKEYEPERND